MGARFLPFPHSSDLLLDFKELRTDQTVEYLMAIHNTWLIELFLCFRDQFPQRRSKDLKTDILHSTFSTGKSPTSPVTVKIYT